MLPSLTLDDAKSYAKKHGGKCLSNSYRNIRSNLKWQCKKGHIWESAFLNMRSRNDWCKKCSGKEITIEQVHLAAISNNGELVKATKITANSFASWKCKKGHIWLATINSILQGSWCRKCSLNKKKPNISLFKKIAISKGGKCLSSKYISKEHYLVFQCKKGHVWSAKPASIKKGSWCHYCRRYFDKNNVIQILKDFNSKLIKLEDGYVTNNTCITYECKNNHIVTQKFRGLKNRSCPKCSYINRRLSIDELIKLATNRKGKCISTDYINNKQKIEWECENKHRWFATYSAIKKGSWCPFCIKITLDDAINVAKNKNGECLSASVSNSKDKLLWRCISGHEWKANYSSVKSGYWCPHCAGVAKKNIEDAKKLAIKNGGKCLSTKYINSTVKMKWQCKRSHIWLATYNTIYNGCWCPFCRKNSIDDAKRWAKKLKGKCLSSNYKDAKSMLKWQCRKGHNWLASYNNVIHNKTWCPACNSSGCQAILTKIIEDIFNVDVISNYRKLSWLRNPKTGMALELDIWVPEVKLAIEYDGIQHFEPTSFGGNETEYDMINNLYNIQKNDKIKNMLIKNSKDIDYFIRFDYKENNKLCKEYVMSKLKLHGVPL